MGNNKKALLLGASGLTGGHCLQLLLNDDFYNEVEIWVRKPLGISNAKLTEKIIDFDNLSTAATNAQYVFCCIGTTIKKAQSKENFYKTDHDVVIALAKIAEQSAAEKFLYVSSIGANSRSSNFYLRTKGNVENDLKKYRFAGLYILRPSMLMGKRNEFRFGEMTGKVLMKGLQLLLIGSLKKYRGIKASTVAKAMNHYAKSDTSGTFIIESDEIQKYN